MKRLLNDPSTRFFSRELSWLAFNDRVLDEAADPSNALLERLKFLVIVSTNLEEFFMVRIAALHRMRTKIKHRDGFRTKDLLFKIRTWVYDQKLRQSRLFEEITTELKAKGLFIELGSSELGRQVFEEKVLPHIFPQKIFEGQKLPPIRGGKLYILAKHGKTRSLIEIPPELPRLLIVKTKHVFLVDRLIYAHRDLLFKKNPAEELFSFKISRDAELDLDSDPDDPLKDIEESIKDRDTGTIVRIEVDSLQESDSVDWLQKELGFEDKALYRFTLPLDLKAFMSVYDIKRFKKLRANFPEPKKPAVLEKTDSDARFFRVLEQNDILLHHPFVAFDPVVDLVRHAATDPKVTRICQTLYRTSGKSGILEALIQAAQNGKKVTALVELKARFDEANNIRWARALEKAGARVIYSSPELKVHAKLTYVERKIGREHRGYVHISTGNYHPRTAKFYTDLGLITTHALYVHDAKYLFDQMEKMDDAEDFSPVLADDGEFSKGFKCWSVAPAKLHDQIISWIDREAAHAKAGRPAGIRAKMNGLVESEVIEGLYRASDAGIDVDLFVRGMCCLRPQVKKLSEHIRVRSIVDKYLEHSRIFIFENGGEREVYLSSADWMPRNFFKRIEIAVPVLNPAIIEYLSNVVWKVYDADNMRARECSPEGLYTKVMPLGQPNHRSQFEFEKLTIPSFRTHKPTAAPAPETPAAPQDSPSSRAPK